MDVNIWPYIELSRLLINKERKGLGNMFRHQFETFVILLEYGYEDPALLKAALIHDLFEDGQKVGFYDFGSVITIDKDGKEVYDLVNELSIRVKENVKEPKDQFLKRIMEYGSPKSKILKLADRLSNINSLNSIDDRSFIKRYIEETNINIMPYADGIDKNIADELRRSLMKFE